MSALDRSQRMVAMPVFQTAVYLHMLTPLISTMSRTVLLTEADAALCGTYFKPVIISKKTILEEQEKIPQCLYFIISGFMRLFYIDDKGEEVTSRIAGKNDFLAPYLSFINQTRSPENVECITNCELLKISRPHLVNLIDSSESFKKFSILIFEQAITSTETRAKDLATLTAEDRYKKMLTSEPEILQNVPIQYIASYLGIKPQSLSRIRRKIIT